MNKAMKVCFGSAVVALTAASIIGGLKFTRAITSQDGWAMGAAAGLSVLGAVMMIGLIAHEAWPELE